MSAALDQQIAHYRDLTYQALRAALPAREPRSYLYDVIAAHLSRAGKGLRPALCIATCRAYGGSIEQALHSAVAIELLHNAFLVHDDIEDGSLYRRNHPTMYVEHGIPIAINVGDAMNAMSIKPLIDNLAVLGPELAGRIFYEIHHMVIQSVEGQAMELGWTRDNAFDLTVEDYLRLILKKTCWYTCIHPCRIGAMVGSGGRAEPDQLNLFGYYLGAAFQIQDDILNLVGDRDTYGKELLGDLWEGKRTLMLVHALRHGSADERARLRRMFAAPRAGRLARDVQWVYGLLTRYDSIGFAQSVLHAMVEAATREFERTYGILPHSQDRELIRGIIHRVAERSF